MNGTGQFLSTALSKNVVLSPLQSSPTDPVRRPFPHEQGFSFQISQDQPAHPPIWDWFADPFPENLRDACRHVCHTWYQGFYLTHLKYGPCLCSCPLQGLFPFQVYCSTHKRASCTIQLIFSPRSTEYCFIVFIPLALLII